MRSQGFAIGSAALVSLALFGAYVSRAGIASVDVIQPKEFVGLIVGAMLPYWFSAMTMKSVGKAALAMVEEVRRQFRTIPGLMEGTTKPDYKRCVEISTDASIKEMIPPGALVMLTPLIVGTLFGVETLAGLLAGALVSGVQVSLSLHLESSFVSFDVTLTLEFRTFRSIRTQNCFTKHFDMVHSTRGIWAVDCGSFIHAHCSELRAAQYGCCKSNI